MRLKFPWPWPVLFSPNTPGPALPQRWPPPLGGYRLCLCCRQCGQRLELAGEEAGGELLEVAQAFGFAVLGSRWLVSGLCARCRGMQA